MTFLRKWQRERIRGICQGAFRPTGCAIPGPCIKEIEVTRNEIKETELRLTKAIEQVRGEIKETELKLTTQMKEVELNLTKEIEQIKSSTIKWVKGYTISLSAAAAFAPMNLSSYR